MADTMTGNFTLQRIRSEPDAPETPDSNESNSIQGTAAMEIEGGTNEKTVVLPPNTVNKAVDLLPLFNLNDTEIKGLMVYGEVQGVPVAIKEEDGNPIDPANCVKVKGKFLFMADEMEIVRPGVPPTPPFSAVRFANFSTSQGATVIIKVGTRLP